jgi:opacity protein-like surface antigen
MRKHLILSAVAALAVGGTALADDLNYSYVQGELHGSRLSANGDSEDGSGLGLGGSYGFARNFFGAVALDSNKYSDNGFSIRFTNLSLGVGGHLPITSMIDFVGGASYESTKIKAGSSETFTGWGLNAGLRGAINDKFQWNGGLRYSDVEDLKTTIEISAGGRYYFTSAFSAGLNVTRRMYDKDTLDFNETILAVTARYEFPGL